MSESLVDLTTTVFQANVVLAVIFGAGYIFAKHTSAATLSGLNRTVLLPSLLFSVIASSAYLTWARFLQIVWPALLVAVVTHVPSILFTVIARRYLAGPIWIGRPLVYHNSLSYPLLLVTALAQVSDEDKALGHLRWRVMDSVHGVVERATLYILINWVITELARLLITPIVERVSPLPAPEPTDDLDVPTPVHPLDEEDATERTPLVAAPARSKLGKKATYTSPALIATVMGLFISIVKPLQRSLLGITPDDQAGSWAWQSLGTAFQVLGAVYAILDIVRAGVELREAEESSDEEVPPTLGNVLVLSLWRYLLVPLFTIPLVYGLAKMPSTKFYLQDPTFSFILTLVVFSPPTSLPVRTRFASSILFSHYLTSLVLALPVAVSLSYLGHGVSYETDFDLVGALKSAGGGGLAGAAAMVVQVLTLMPMRTIMNYQYRYGGGFKGATKTLWNDGGFKRYYAGLAAALFQGPFSRFGDTAANSFILALLATLTWPVLIKTIAASVASACFRMILTPIDTLKTTQQTNGAAGGLKLLRERVKERGIGCLWYGALATAAATFVGHYPWFATYNYLEGALPPSHNLLQKLLRQAFIGFSASVVSDTISNSLRVVKTYRQTHEGDVGYVAAAKEIVASEGLLGLFGRGLGTRLLTNGLQGLLFSILWKFFGELISGKK